MASPEYLDVSTSTKRVKPSFATVLVILLLSAVTASVASATPPDPGAGVSQLTAASDTDVFLSTAAGTGLPEIVVLGGLGAVSADVQLHLSSCTALPVRRVSGSNRYATAAAVSADTFASATEAFIATGGNFPDAVAAGSPAALAGAPVLLTASAELSGEVAAELTRLGVSDIFILGGTGAVSDAVETALGGYGTTHRLSGANRYATAAAISQARFPTASTVYVATGLNFPDALAGAPAAAADSAPILLVTKDSIPAATQAELDRLNPTSTVVLGGTGVISDSVANALPGTVTRLAGGNRYATAAAISAATFSPGVPVIYITTGLNFPDALAGGAAAGFRGGPILLVSGTSVPAETAAEVARLTGIPCSPLAPPPPTTTTTTTTTSTTTTTTIPGNPGDSVNCSDFATQAQAQAYFNTYYPYYGDVAGLDADNDLIACESLP